MSLQCLDTRPIARNDFQSCNGCDRHFPTIMAALDHEAVCKKPRSKREKEAQAINWNTWVYG